MKFRPLHDRIVIKRIDAEAKTAAWHHHSRYRQGEAAAGRASLRPVPAVATRAANLSPVDVKLRDRVLFGKWSGTEVKIDDVEYLIMNESDIMGVLVEAEAHSKKAA